jgi:hypothetical protein
MRFAFGRRAGMLSRALGFVAVLCFVSVLGAHSASAQPTFKSGDWGTADGGAVAVKPDGSFDAAFTDSETSEAVFTTGKVVNRQAAGDSLELTLKPNGKDETYVIVVHADGNAELFRVSGGARHKAAVLTK